MSISGRPRPDEADPYYFRYIDLVAGEDSLRLMQSQVEEMAGLCAGISEEKSLFRYAPGKWSLRQVLNHVTDSERAFAFRALWFARGFEPPLPGFDQEIAAAGAGADQTAWSNHVEEFQRVRLASLALFASLPDQAWTRTGVASDKRFSVRAVAFLIPGHAAHHLNILRERYLGG